MELNIGINAQDRQDIASGLSKLLADSYSLYLKTHNYHWNVTGPQFNTLHTMFEQQYTELAAAVDEIAELLLEASEIVLATTIAPDRVDDRHPHQVLLVTGQHDVSADRHIVGDISADRPGFRIAIPLDDPIHQPGGELCQRLRQNRC